MSIRLGFAIPALLVITGCATAPRDIGAEGGGSVALSAYNDRPNVLVIVADDLAYTDIGAFGGEIATPNLDGLARRGVMLSQFYTAPTCSPTRSMLLTGRDNHEVGLGSMAELTQPVQAGRPGYEGYLRRDFVTLPQAMQAAGYTTLMSGKWHLGMTMDASPSQSGFDHSFALLNGAHNHFGADQTPLDRANGTEPSYREDGELVPYPVGAYSSDYFADRMIGYLDTAPADKPVFAYLAFTAPHWPLQAPEDEIAKYRGFYDAGPQALRNRRIEQVMKLGVVSPDVMPATGDFADWSSLPPEVRKIESRKMEIYAAMVDRMDQNIGRVLDKLETDGRLENTVVVFLSDNGAEGVRINGKLALDNPAKPVNDSVDNTFPNLGKSTSFFSYGPDWTP